MGSRFRIHEWETETLLIQLLLAVRASQQEPVRERGILTARKIRMRLGGGENIMAPFPDKPKGMHWRTYDRLRRVHDHAFERPLMGLAKSAERVERWLRA
jgi:hypothetical protein